MPKRKRKQPKQTESPVAAAALEPNEASGRRNLAAALICVAATMASLAPFATKAFNIDDTLFLYAAQQICVKPWNPYGFEVNWYGVGMRMAEVTQNPPSISYFIALVGTCFGWNEAAMHLAFLIPAVAAVLGTYFLALRFCGKALLAALMTLFCPVFLVSSTTLMCDTAMLAFWVWAVVLWQRGMESRNHVWPILSSGLIALAVVTKYFAIALVPLLLVHSLLHWSRVKWRVLYLLIPIAALAAYDHVMRSLYGHSVVYSASSYALATGGRTDYLNRGRIALTFTGGCMATVLFYAPLLWSRRVVLIALLVTAELVAMASMGTGAAGRVQFLLNLQFVVFGVIGAALLALAIADFWRFRNAESFLLVAWTVGTFVFCWIFNWTVNGRSILPMAPPASILIVRRLEWRWKDWTGRARSWVSLPLVLVGLLALGVTWADTLLANSAREAAAEIYAELGQHKDHVWFTGHWGFQYYMEVCEFRPLDIRHSKMALGDVVVMPENNTNVPPLPKNRFVESAKLQYPACPVLTTMSVPMDAGFYASVIGSLPFAFGPVPPEEYRVMTLSPH